MAKYFGRKIGVGLGKETTRGTAVAATHWQAQMELDFDEQVEVARLEAGYGTIVKQRDAVITARWGEGTLSGPILDKPFGLILLSLFGTDTPVAFSGGDSAVYTHTFTIAESAQHQSLTISTDEANGDYRFPLAVVDELEIEYTLGKIVEFKAKLMAQKGASATNTPSYATDAYYFRPQDFSFKYAADVAGLGGASATPLRAFKINMKQGAVREHVLGSTDPRDFPNGEWEGTGELEFVMEDETMKALVLAGTKRAMLISLVNSGQTIGATKNPSLIITLEEVQFDKYSRDKKLGDLVVVKIGFTANYKLSASRLGAIDLINLVASY